jgi:hypothetical protein
MFLMRKKRVKQVLTKKASYEQQIRTKVKEEQYKTNFYH